MTWQNKVVGYKEMPANQLLANPDNARRHPARQREALRGSLDSIGFAAPVLLNIVTGYIIDGHARIEEALTVDEDYLVPVIEVELTEAEEKQFLASYDYITMLAEYDRNALKSLLQDVNSDDARVQALLSGLAEDNDLYFGDAPIIPDNPEPQIDRAAELNETWQVKRGDLWIIPSVTGDGEHRLLCGDSTNEAGVARLMGDSKADAVVTDPPYGQNQLGVTNDEPENLSHIINDSIDLFPIDNGIVCLFQSPRTFVVGLDALRRSGFNFERMLWMYKQAQMTYPWRGWLLTSEAILIASCGKALWQDEKPYSHDCYMMAELSNELPPNSGWHGSVKPLHVVKDIIKRVSFDIVYDPFGGSGTTMVACEQLQRQCRMIEIEPKYCAVILERMSAMGCEPQRIESD